MPTWLPILRRKGCPVLFYSYINHGYKTPYHSELLGIQRGIRYHRYVDGWVIIALEDSEAFQQTFSERLEQDGYPEFFLRQCRRVSDDLFAFGDECRYQTYDSWSTGELLFAFMRFSSLSIRAMPFLTTIVLLQDVLEKRLAGALARAWNIPVESDELSGRMQALMLEGGEVPLATEAVRDLVRVAENITQGHTSLSQRLSVDPPPDQTSVNRDWPEIGKEIDAHLRAYDFLGTDYYVGDPLSFEQVLVQIASLLHQPPAGASAPPSVAADPSLDPDATQLLATARELHFLRQHRIEAMFKAGRDARELFEEIGSRVGLSYDELLHLTFEEVQESLTIGHPAIPLAAIAERRRDYAVVIEDENAAIVIGTDIDKLRADLPLQEKHGSRLLGVTAFPGACSAPACVVDRLQDIGRVKAGEVLVAPMTSPYHVPAMTISGAVVTDEGGILSHAAIVARELRIPCVVGVSGATTTIQSGQRLDIDARPGVGVVEIA